MDSKDFKFLGMKLTDLIDNDESRFDASVLEMMHSIQAMVMALTAGKWRNRSVFFAHVKINDHHLPALVYRVPDPLEQVDPRDCCEVFPSLDAMFWYLVGARLAD